MIAFCLGPGHIPIGSEPGTEYHQFSPVDELRIVSETIMRNAQVMQEPGVAADA